MFRQQLIAGFQIITYMSPALLGWHFSSLVVTQLITLKWIHNLNVSKEIIKIQNNNKVDTSLTLCSDYRLRQIICK